MRFKTNMLYLYLYICRIYYKKGIFIMISKTFKFPLKYNPQPRWNSRFLPSERPAVGSIYLMTEPIPCRLLRPA